MTNSEVLQKINDLKLEIDEQTLLCKNIVKVENVTSKDIQNLLDSTLEKIDTLKKYQQIILNRNYLEFIEYNSENINIQTLIKRKEKLLLKKKFETILINSYNDTEGLVKISIDAFQHVQEYKKELSKIHSILNIFNNTQFKLEEYK